jgi:hypothetical protein
VDDCAEGTLNQVERKDDDAPFLVNGIKMD